jgi:hypothetical protein
MTHAEPREGSLNVEQDGLSAGQEPDLSAGQEPAFSTGQQPDLSTEQRDDLSTEQIARAGTERTDQPSRQAQSAEQAVAARPHGDEQARVQLFGQDELEGIVDRWRDIQASFVDEPQKAVKDADSLVAELMQRLARTFASQREQLESSWSTGDSVSTEDLRQGLQRYRSFFERLLAA